MHAPYLTVVVPCYNESENLRRGVLDEMHSYLCEQDYAYEVVVSDDDSTDDSRDLVRGIATSRLPARRERPRWQALRRVGRHSGGPGSIVLFTDMDQSTPIDQIARPPRFRGLRRVIGSRGYSRRDFPLYRRLGSAVFRAFRRLLLLRNISDTQCGFKAMRTDVARCLFPRLEAIARPTQASGWRVTAFDVELLYLAERAGLAIAEVVVEWSDRDVSRGKGKSYWRESKEMAEQVWRIKRNAWRGLYRMEDGPCSDQGGDHRGGARSACASPADPHRPRRHESQSFASSSRRYAQGSKRFASSCARVMRRPMPQRPTSTRPPDLSAAGGAPGPRPCRVLRARIRRWRAVPAPRWRPPLR